MTGRVPFGPAAPRPAVGGTSHRRGWLVAGLVTAVVLLVGSVGGAVTLANGGRTTALTANGWTVSGPGSQWGGMMGDRVRTSVPQLAGTTVQVTAVDMGGMMGAGGPMRLVLDRSAVSSGTVSLVLNNAGFRTHELVVLPLPDGQQVGSRTVGADGKVDESGSLGEASRSGAADAGDGITAGAAGWTTLQLPAGRYELICNLPGHYAAGMYVELTVS